MKKLLALVAFALAAPACAQTVTPISALPSATTLSGTEVVPIVQSSTTKKATAAQIQQSGTQSANTVLAAPNGAAGSPSFRALVPTDLGSQSANTVLAGPNGAGGSPSFRALVAVDANFAAPHVADNPTLLASSTLAYPYGVWRDTFSNSVKAPPLFYTPSGSACSLNAGAGDNGSQVQSSNGKCWIAAIGNGSHVSTSEWGMSSGAADNGPLLAAAMKWAGTVNGAYLDVDQGVFTFTSTADCGSANGMTLEGRGTLTEFYGTADFGPFITCSNARSLHFKNLWLYHFIGNTPISSFINPTTSSSLMVLTDVSQSTIEGVTFWNGGPYNLSLQRAVDMLIWHCAFTGFYDGTHNQTLADLFIDGQAGTGLGVPTLITIDGDTRFEGPINPNQTVTITSGGNSRTVSTFSKMLGAYEHIRVNAVEGLNLASGIMDNAYLYGLHLAPRGDTTRPILKVNIGRNFWLDGAGNADVLIENAGTANNTYAAAQDINISSAYADGETSGYVAVSVPNSSGIIAANGLFINGVDASAYVTTPFNLQAVNGGYLKGGSIRSYNYYGPYANDPVNGSAVYVGGISTNFTVAPDSVGGGQNYETIDLAHLPGTSPYAADQAQYGVSLASGLVGVRRGPYLNAGYYTDYSGAAPTCTSAPASCALATGSDNAHGQVSIGTGSVTSGTVLFSGAMLNPAPGNVMCRASDGLASGGTPLLISVNSNGYNGFTWVSSSSIGGGSFKYTCDN